MPAQKTMNLPPVVSAAEWQAARDKLLAKEKEATRARDALAAERRRLPRVEIDKDYVFDGPNGEASLLDLFDGRRQLILYHFMFGPNQDEGCDGCSMFVDQIGHLAHLHARDTSFVLVSRAPLAKIEPYRERMGWTVPWFSSFGSDIMSTSAALLRPLNRRNTRTAKGLASASSFASATPSFVATSRTGAASRPSGASGPSSI